MQPPKLTKHSDDLVIKKEAWINLILGFPALSLLAIALFFGKATRPFFRENSLLSIAVLLIILAALYFWVRNSLDKRIKMVINKEGIWAHNKGLLVWSNIHYYYFEEVRSDYDTVTLLKVKLLKPDKEVKIDISFFNVSERDIDVAIENNSGSPKTIALKERY